VIVQLLIPVKQRLQTAVSREAFIADPTAWDKFKDGVVAALGKSPRGVPFTRDNIVIDSITAVSAVRRALQETTPFSPPAAATSDAYGPMQRRLTTGTLEISYWISLTEQEVNPATYTSSPAFAAHFAAIVASLASPVLCSSIETSLATASIQVVALAPSVPSSTSEVVVVVLQGAPTQAPALAAVVSAEQEASGAVAIYISVSVLASAALAAYAYHKKWGRGQSKVGVGDPQDENKEKRSERIGISAAALMSAAAALWAHCMSMWGKGRGQPKVGIDPQSQDERESGAKLVSAEPHAVSPHDAGEPVDKAPTVKKKFGRGHGNGHRPHKPHNIDIEAGSSSDHAVEVREAGML
jgi:hypothetical protein